MVAGPIPGYSRRTGPLLQKPSATLWEPYTEPAELAQDLREAEARRRKLALQLSLGPPVAVPQPDELPPSVTAARSLLEARYGGGPRDPPVIPSNAAVAEGSSATITALRWRAQAEKLGSKVEKLEKENAALRNVVGSNIDANEASGLLTKVRQLQRDVRRVSARPAALDAMRAALRNVAPRCVLRDVMVAWRFTSSLKAYDVTPVSSEDVHPQGWGRTMGQWIGAASSGEDWNAFGKSDDDALHQQRLEELREYLSKQTTNSKPQSAPKAKAAEDWNRPKPKRKARGKAGKSPARPTRGAPSGSTPDQPASLDAQDDAPTLVSTTLPVPADPPGDASGEAAQPEPSDPLTAAPTPVAASFPDEPPDVEQVKEEMSTLPGPSELETIAATADPPELEVEPTSPVSALGFVYSYDPGSAEEEYNIWGEEVTEEDRARRRKEAQFAFDQLKIGVGIPLRRPMWGGDNAQGSTGTAMQAGHAKPKRRPRKKRDQDTKT